MPPPLIIGGGPAGATAATLIARAGRPVTLIERTTGPTDKVCGDFLSGEAMAMLGGLGVDLAALSPAPIHRLRLVHGAAVAETDLPFPACGLTRRSLDEALLAVATTSGADVRRGHLVRGVRAGRGHWTVRADALGEVSTGTVFLATGKHDVRDLSRPGRDAGSVGFKTYLRLAPGQQAALRDHVELVLFPGGYAGLQCVEAERAVLCLMTGGHGLARDGASRTGFKDGFEGILEAVLRVCPHLAVRLAGATWLLDRPLAIAGIPYGFLYRADALAPPGLFRLGDQAAVIPSLTGDGVAIALHSATLAVAAWLAGGNASVAYHRRLVQTLRGQMRVAGLLQRGCLLPWAQAPLVAIGQWSPVLLRLAARWTRLPHPTAVVP